LRRGRSALPFLPYRRAYDRCANSYLRFRARWEPFCRPCSGRARVRSAAIGFGGGAWAEIRLIAIVHTVRGLLIYARIFRVDWRCYGLASGRGPALASLFFVMDGTSHRPCASTADGPGHAQIKFQADCYFGPGPSAGFMQRFVHAMGGGGGGGGGGALPWWLGAAAVRCDGGLQVRAFANTTFDNVEGVTFGAAPFRPQWRLRGGFIVSVRSGRDDLPAVRVATSFVGLAPGAQDTMIGSGAGPYPRPCFLSAAHHLSLSGRDPFRSQLDGARVDAVTIQGDTPTSAWPCRATKGSCVCLVAANARSLSGRLSRSHTPRALPPAFYQHTRDRATA